MQDVDALLRVARVVADAIAATFGPDCEVAVHDLSDPTRSLVHLANGHVTGRQPGAPIRDLIGRVIPSLDPGEDILAAYLTVLDDGRHLKSTTAILRDEEDNPRVALCININLARFEGAAEALNELVRVNDDDEPRPDPGNGRFDSPRDLLTVLVDNVVGRFGKPAQQLTKSERLDVVAFMSDKGAFLIKGAVPMVAERLGVSEPTVYRYVDQVSRDH